MNFTPQELLSMAKENGDQAILFQAGRRQYSKKEHTTATLLMANAHHEIQGLENCKSFQTLAETINECAKAIAIWESSANR